jgi:hypothetical protein
VEANSTNSFGIEQTRDVVRFAGRLTRAVRETMSDDRINVKDVRWLFNVIPTIKPALDGFKQVKYEVLDLSSNEMTELAQLFASEAQIQHTPILQEQLRQQLATGGGWTGMVIAMTRIGKPIDANESPLQTE